MTDRPQDPQLIWTDAGPRSARFGDVYFSAEDGLSESRGVFLRGAGLPEAWRGRRRFTVGELGFGTGLNILALLELWSRERPSGARLQVFTVEAFPLSVDEAARAHAAWPELAKEQGWYGTDDRIDDALPYLNRDLGWDDRAWGATQQGFDTLLRHYVKPGMRILEIGAAKSWASQRLIPLGCEYVAADLVVDPVIGLGRGAYFEQKVGPYLRVQADGERLPFAEGAFDLAFCVATLHHAIDLRAMVSELARVTRRGGIVAGLNEGTRAPYRSGENPDQEHEKELGINEHVHTMWAYVAAFTRAGLRPVRLEYAEGPDKLRERNIAGKLLRIGKMPATLWALNAYPYAGLSLYARRR